MATPPRKLISDNLKSTLESILVAGGFKTTVVKVETVLREWDEIGDSTQMPWLGFMLDTETFDHEPGGMIWCTLPFIIVGYVNVDDTTRRGIVSDLLDDIIKALEADTTRGANAVVTSITEQGTDEADPDFLVSKGGEARIQVKGTIEYQRTTAGS